ncbi:helix-turn-helix domain-containing protein [Pelomicrobium methylotrophicum]|uniref:Helix-turn-helix domain-containing protein n=1 Tax=Pelomicrobium methylotrophicum TaxID=2602750 RepID=A0A5C7EVJ3_9PROT|nr:RodZ domain-containing protein [Pelomicrobium methylotrophicum]TXF11066.1 helix-turn-helix domain-containing protein [Pelomicrobium methylotrophicum]
MDRHEDKEALETQGPGRRLADERRRQGLSVVEIGRLIKLAPRQVEALEADDYERLPGNTFVRGFVRNYAKALRLDPEPLLAELEQRLPPERPSAILPHTENIPFSPGHGEGWRRYLLLALLVLLVVPWALYEVYRQQPAAPAAPSPGVALPIVPPSATKPGGTAVAVPERASGAAPASDQAAAPGAGAPVPAPSAAHQAASPAGAPGQASVRLAFKKDSWVEIKDREGKIVFAQLNKGGTEQVVQGVPPLSLVVGNATQVTLEYNGKPVDLAPYTRGEVARLTLE